MKISLFESCAITPKKYCCLSNRQSLLNFFSVLISILTISIESDAQNVDYLNNRSPLIQKPYIELPLGSIKADGWLYEMLDRQRKGLTGEMDVRYSQVMGPRNGWLGGDGDVWERGPYWIDGLLPLAYILNDKQLIEKTQRWIEWCLSSQQPNGYFGPNTDRSDEEGLQRNNSRDWWPKMVMLKVMQQYYMATKDERVITFLTNYFRYQLNELPSKPLGNWTFWGEQRGGDNLMVVYWLYNLTGEKFLLELGELIHSQTFNWTDVFLNQNHLYRQQSLHCVNLAHGFKEPIIYYQQSQDRKYVDAVKKAMETIRHTIGFPIGLWGGDELLRYGNPINGSELCTAVEMMFSLEKMLEITGDIQWADQLERIAYNAMPAQIADDFSCRQYFQQINQISVTNEYHHFVTPHEGTDNVFGVLTGYPCCTSNFHQGWPKLVQSLWYASADNGVAAMVYAPSEVNLLVADSISVNICEETHYPFDEKASFRFSFDDKAVFQARFPFYLRVPGWCKQPVVKLNDQTLDYTIADNTLKLIRDWRSKDKLTIEFPAEIKVSYWYDHAAVIERGPLVYALKMDEKWEKKSFKTAVEKKKYGDWYYEVTTSSPWNYALMKSRLNEKLLNENFIVEKRSSVAIHPWTQEEAPISIRTKARRMDSWEKNRGSVGAIPYNVQHHDQPSPEDIEIELIPYGCTTLRITEFPIR